MAKHDHFTSENQPMFRPGRPAGKDKAVIEAIERWAKGDKEKFWDTIVKRAMNPNDPAGPGLLRDITNRLMPAKKAVMPEYNFDFPHDANAADRIDAIATACAAGVLPLDVGQMMVGIIKDGMQVREITELADRLAALEERLGGKE